MAVLRLNATANIGSARLLGVPTRVRHCPRRPVVRPFAAKRQVAVAVPQPQPPAPDPKAAAPKWLFGAGMMAVAAAALKLAWSLRKPAAVVPPPPPPSQAPTNERPPPVAQATTAAAAPAAATAPIAAPSAEPSPALEAARAAVRHAGESLAAANGDDAAAAAAAAVGPVLLAAETGGIVDDTPTMGLEQLRSTATELYMLIQQMELHLQEMAAELSAGLPEASLDQLDAMAAQLEEAEEQLSNLRGRGAGEEEVVAAEQAYASLQWQQFEVLTAQAGDRDRRSYRSLLFNLRTQRQLLRQVEAQEALRLRMAATEARISALLKEEQRQVDGDRGAPPRAEAGRPAGVQTAAPAQRAPPPQPQQQQQQEVPDVVGSSFVVPEQAAAAAAQPAAPVAAAAAVRWDEQQQAQQAQQQQQQAESAAQQAQRAPAALQLAAAGACIPHPAKAASGGEDAFFVSAAGRGAVGVADGVGGWAAEGVDPALYPRRFVAACQEVLEGPGAAELVSAEEDAAGLLMEAAYDWTEEPGSATVILGVLLPGGRLSVANVGDCGLRVVRGGRVAYESQVLEHQWNMPLQLSCPQFYDCGTRPADAETAVVEVQEGDVVVLGSDGLWDNLWERQLLAAVDEEQREAGGEVLAERLALRLAREAHRQACDPTFVSPFSVERQQRMAGAASAAGVALPAAGGKKDDVTAVVAVVAADTGMGGGGW